MTWSETDDGKEWDDFVVQNHGTASQSWAWRGVEEPTSKRPKYLACRDSTGALKAICPFFLVKESRYLSILDSPAGFRGGPLFRSGAENIPLAMESLKHSVKSSVLNPIEFLLVSTYDKEVVNSLMNSGYAYKIKWGLFILDLKEISLDHIWTKLFDNGDRRNIKYFDSLGCSFRLAENDKEWDEFLDLENRSMKRQGYHPLSREGLRRWRSNFGENLRLLEVVSPDGDLVAAVTTISNPDKTMVHWAHIGYSRDRSSKSAYSYAIWKLVGWALAEGFRYVDLGGTNPDPKDPVHRVKRKFGGDFVPVYTYKIPLSSHFLPMAKRAYACAKWAASTIGIV